MATSTIPIVFRVGSDPVATGLVDALNRPGGNLTGVTTMGAELGPKRLELLHELVPGATSVAALLNPANTAADSQAKGIQAAAGALGLRVHVLHASTDREIDNAFAALDKLGVGALLIGNDGFFSTQSERLGRLTAQHGVAAMGGFQTREFAVGGGLMSYEESLSQEQDRQTGVYVGRILKGAKPADLPVVQPTKFELVINLKTAKALGLTIPPALLARADELIE
jgi:putative tryptophan/tyrosine transport system substrate-binding protein